MMDKYQRLVAMCSLGAGLVLALLGFLSEGVAVRATPGAELRVCPTGCSYASVQQAVDDASDGDVIKVAAGTYTDIHARAGVTQVVYIDRSVTLQGGYTPADWDTPDPTANPTILDARDQGRVIYITGPLTCSIQGFQIMGGNAEGMGSGGGILAIKAAVNIADNLIESNSTALIAWSHGGGVSLSSCTGTLSGNVIRDNDAYMWGGGVHVSGGSIEVRANTFVGNWASHGGGLYADTYLGECTIVQNLFQGNETGGTGGGLSAWGPVHIASNTIISNTSDPSYGGGGGAYLTGNPAGSMFEGNIVRWNIGAKGGGLLISNGSEVQVINNIIADNESTDRGAAVHVDGGVPHLTYNTIARNSGGDGSGIHVRCYIGCGSPILTNNILVGHTTGISATAGTTVTVDGILWYDTPVTVASDANAAITVQNEYTGDPAFSADGSHITLASAALDRGVPSAIRSDIDGEARPFGDGPDLGADEWASVQMTVDPSVPSVLDATADGLTTTVAIPAGAVTDTIRLEYTALADTGHPSPEGLTFTGKAFDIEAYQGEALLTGFVFRVPITITVHYAESDLMGAEEDTLILEYWDGFGWQNAACGEYERSPEGNWLWVPICHLSRFAVFGEPYERVYLPIVVRSYPQP